MKRRGRRDSGGPRGSPTFARIAQSVCLLFVLHLDASHAGAPANDAQAGAAGEPARLCLFCRDYAHLVGNDVVHVFKAPAQWDGHDWKKIGLRAGIVVASGVLLDRRVSNYVAEHPSDTRERIADRFERFGAEDALLVGAGFYVGGALAHNPKAKAVALDGFAAALINAAMIVPALKKITGRDRPNAGNGADSFHPFQGGESFPSGHTVGAFTLATSIASHYDSPWIKGASYGVAALVGYSRIEHQAHFVSDVVAGAMIGVGVTKGVVALNRTMRGNLALEPTVTPGGYALALSVSF